jgi:hypothetical protein
VAGASWTADAGSLERIPQGEALRAKGHRDMASKDKGAKATKKEPKKNLKEKRAEKKAKKTSN